MRKVWRWPGAFAVEVKQTRKKKHERWRSGERESGSESVMRTRWWKGEE